MLNLNFNAFSGLITNIKNRFSANDEYAVSRRNLIISNYSGSVTGNLVGGNFLTGLLLLLGADDAFMGIIAMVGLVGNLVQIFSPLFLERFESRKKILVAGRCVVYLFNIVIIGIVPLLPVVNKHKLIFILIVILTTNLINSILSPGYMVWHIKSVPENIRARYFSFFNVTNGIIIYTVLIGTSKFVDYFKANGKELEALLSLRVIAFLICIIDVIFLFKINEYPNKSDGNAIKLRNILIYPLKNKQYIITVLITCLWSFSANIPGPYFGIYLLKDIKIDYSFINIVNMLNVPVLIFITPLWKKRIEATSWFKILNFAMALFLIHYIGLAFVSKGTLFLYPISAVYSFIIAAALNLVFANMPYIYMPEGNQTSFISFYSTMNTIAALLGVTAGREFIKHTEELKLSLLGFEMGNKQYILLVTAFIMMLAVISIKVLRKKIEVTNLE